MAERFAELQTRAEGKAVGPLCVNPTFRSWLKDEILPAAPNHFSASMLLMQGNLERPTRIERGVAARILRSGLDPLADLGKAPLAKLSPSGIKAVVTAVQSDIQPFTKYFRTEDDELTKEALTLLERALTFGRRLQFATKGPDGVLMAHSDTPMSTLQQEFREELETFNRKLAPHTGERFPDPVAPPPPVPAPAAP